MAKSKDYNFLIKICLSVLKFQLHYSLHASFVILMRLILIPLDSGNLASGFMRTLVAVYGYVPKAINNYSHA